MRIINSVNIHLSEAIKFYLIPSEKCDEQGVLLYTQSPHQVLKCGDFCFLKVWARAMQLPVSWAFCLFSTWCG